MADKVQHIRKIPEKDVRQQFTDLLKGRNVIDDTFTGTIMLGFQRGVLISINQPGRETWDKTH